MGYHTGTALRSLRDRTTSSLVSVFVPSSPTPMTGYVVFLPEEELIPLDITVEQAFRMVISGGLIKPDEDQRIKGRAADRQIDAPQIEPTGPE